MSDDERGAALLQRLKDGFSLKGVSCVPIEYGNRGFWVDLMHNDGYSIQDRNDPKSFVKVWNLKDAVMVITNWRK